MRFVILEHQQVNNRHWDLMLEQPFGDLRTWALPRTLCHGIPQEVKELPLHRQVYLNYQGPVSRSRGWVRRWDRGNYESLSIQPDWLCVLLRGEQLQGVLTLELQDTYPTHLWLASFQKR